MSARLQPLKHHCLLLRSWINSIGVVHSQHTIILACGISNDKFPPIIDRARSHPDSYRSAIRSGASHSLAKSWDVSIRNASRQIERANKRRKAGGYYLQESEIREILEEAFYNALDNASLEAFEGTYSAKDLLKLVARQEAIEQGFKMILEAKNNPDF